MSFQIKAIREKKHITKDELAQMSGISRATISTLENNHTAITTTETLKKIARALDVSIGDIFLDWLSSRLYFLK